jgi:hypothetical protein
MADKMIKFRIGQKIRWKAAGKVSRLDGVRGTIVSGVILGIDGDSLTVEKSYDSIVPMASLDFDSILEAHNG